MARRRRRKLMKTRWAKKERERRSGTLWIVFIRPGARCAYTSRSGDAVSVRRTPLVGNHAAFASLITNHKTNYKSQNQPRHD